MYGNIIWGPHYVLGSRLEGVQWHEQNLYCLYETSLILIEWLHWIYHPCYISTQTWWPSISIQTVKWLFCARLFQLFLHYLTTHIPEVKPPTYYLCHANLFDTRVIKDWNNLTSDIVTNSSLYSFKSAVDILFLTLDLCFIVNVFTVIIIQSLIQK